MVSDREALKIYLDLYFLHMFKNKIDDFSFKIAHILNICSFLYMPFLALLYSSPSPLNTLEIKLAAPLNTAEAACEPNPKPNPAFT